MDSSIFTSHSTSITMTTLRSNVARARKREYSRARKRRITLMRKADQFSKDCQADVYVLIFRDGKFFTYSSLEDEQWPPQLSKVVST